MTRKVYRTAQGKMVDLGALQLRNENVRAVGNMKVNARGDVIDSGNRAIDTRNQQVARQYRRQTGNATEQPVRASQADQGKKITAAAPMPANDVDIDLAEVKTVPTPAQTPAAGLAAAIARAREIRQDTLTTHKNVAQHQAAADKS